MAVSTGRPYENYAYEEDSETTEKKQNDRRRVEEFLVDVAKLYREASPVAHLAIALEPTIPVSATHSAPIAPPITSGLAPMSAANGRNMTRKTIDKAKRIGIQSLPGCLFRCVTHLVSRLVMCSQWESADPAVERAKLTMAGARLTTNTSSYSARIAREPESARDHQLRRHWGHRFLLRPVLRLSRAPGRRCLPLIRLCHRA